MIKSFALDDKIDVRGSRECSLLYTSRMELCPTMHVGNVNFEVKHLVSLGFYNTRNFCIESSNDKTIVGGERILDL